MRWQRLIVYVALILAAWAALAAWRIASMDMSVRRAQTLQRQAESIMSVWSAFAASPARRFFKASFRGRSPNWSPKDILAVAPTTEDGQSVLSAGETQLLDMSSAVTSGTSWTPKDSDSCKTFGSIRMPAVGRVAQETAVGRGRGMRWWAHVEEESPFSTGGRFYAVLLLDRTQADRQCQRAFWLRLWTVIAGGLVFVFVGLAWLATVRLVEAQGHARVLEAETRHLCDLSQAAAGLAHETPSVYRSAVDQRLAATCRPSNRASPRGGRECDRVTADQSVSAFAKLSELKPEPVDIGQLLRASRLAGT